MFSVCNTYQVIVTDVSTQQWGRIFDIDLCRLVGLPRTVRAPFCTVWNELDRRRVSQVNISFKHPRVTRIACSAGQVVSECSRQSQSLALGLILY